MEVNNTATVSTMNQLERENYFNETLDALLIGGASFSEWCTFISKSVYDAFTNGADLATVITAMACIETYFITECPDDKGKSLALLIDESGFSDDQTSQLHKLRKYRNSWVHCKRIDDTDILRNESKYLLEAEEMAILSVKMLLTVLLSDQFIMR